MVDTFKVGDLVRLHSRIIEDCTPGGSVWAVKDKIGTVAEIKDKCYNVIYWDDKGDAIWELFGGEIEHVDGPW